MIRLNKLIATRLGISRRAADKLIAAGNVKVDGRATVLGMPVKEDANVEINGQTSSQAPPAIILLLNKPIGYVCSRRGQGNKTVYDLLPGQYRHLKTVGRLDKDSSGLLLLTNDGQLNQLLTHPSHQKEKVYQVTLDKPLTPADQKIIVKGGVTLVEGTSHMKIKILNDLLLEVILTEGHKRQIRRTFEAIGYKVLKLHRTIFGDYRLNDLPLGSFKVIKIRP